MHAREISGRDPALQQKQEAERITGDCGNENKKESKNLSAVPGSARALGLENCREEKHE
jgi:hypothetical protein